MAKFVKWQNVINYKLCEYLTHSLSFERNICEKGHSRRLTSRQTQIYLTGMTDGDRLRVRLYATRSQQGWAAG